MHNINENKISILGFSIWLLAALFFLYEFFLRTFVGTVAHQVIPDLHLSAETFALLGTAYYVAYGGMQMPVGILTDIFGVKKILIFALLVCSAATFYFAHSTGFISAFTSRVLMGFGSSFAFVCLLVICVMWFPRKYFAFFAGASQFIGTMGPLLAAGPLVAVLSHTNLSWRTLLSYVASFGVVLAFLIFVIMRPKPRDYESEVVKLTHKEPLLKSLKKLMQNKQAWAVALYSATNYVPIAMLGAIWGTIYLQSRGLSQGQAANLISLSWLGYAIGCPLAGAFSDFCRRRKPTLIFCSVLGVVVTIFITYVPDISTMGYAILFFGLGLAASGQNVGFAAMSEHAEPAVKATALGMNNGAMVLFDASMPPLIGYCVGLSAHGDMKHLVPHNFFLGFSVLPILFGLSSIFAIFFIKETFCKPQKEMIILSNS